MAGGGRGKEGRGGKGRRKETQKIYRCQNSVAFLLLLQIILDLYLSHEYVLRLTVNEFSLKLQFLEIFFIILMLSYIIK